MKTFPYKLLWEFGDGEYSTEANPEHPYAMPGVFSPVLTVFDNEGNEKSRVRSGYIRVTDWDINGLHVTYTNTCLRVAVDPNQGVGIVRWGGDRWVWPEAIVGTCRGIAKDNRPLLLVLDNSNGRFWRLGVTNLWTDQTVDGEGHEISTSFRLRENLASGGEYKQIKHIETHAYFRPFADEYKGATGYGSAGFRADHSVTASIYKDGINSPAGKVDKIPLYGDVAHREVQGHRLQTQIDTTASSYRCIGVDTQISVVDSKSVQNALPERFYQREWRTPLLWVSRGAPMVDRVIGVELEGSYSSLSTGPDQKLSALTLGSLDDLPFIIAGLSGDFTLSWWQNSIDPNAAIWTIGSLTISIDADGSVKWSDWANSLEVASGWHGGSWAHFAVERSGNRSRLLLNGVLVGSLELYNAQINYVGDGVFGRAVGDFFDVRIVPRAIEQDACSYYYNNILSFGGSAFLPRMV